MAKDLQKPAAGLGAESRRLCLPYGRGTIEAELNWGRRLGELDIADRPALVKLNEAMGQALNNPIGLEKSLFDIVQPGESVAIIVSDSFRKTAVHEYLPVLLEGLMRAGIAEERICFVFSTGAHRPPTPEEQAVILGPAVFARFQDRLVNHDPCDDANLIAFGTTSRGTPVYFNRQAMECDRVIATGAVVLHYFGGFGGGRKAILPGIAGVKTISHNHSMNLDPEQDRLNPAVRIGALDGNPVAEDMLEGARLGKCDFIINTVLNRAGQITGIFAGELEAAHKKAAEFARELYAVPFSEPADLVIAASGPTKNFVQTHKALYNAYQVMKPNGRIILIAKCEEGLGGDNFAKWIRLGDRASIIAQLRKQSEINGQTALSTIEKAPMTLMVTDMPAADVELLGARKADSLEAALNLARTELARDGQPDPAYYLMPNAAYTVPLKT